jgi:uncharacterized membrane-anchored protein YjiN (DUF445 family)
MKRFPLLLLALMAALFLATLNRPEAWAGWLQAFAEAGMVGALADWFAVVALFRHPLGLPIPHTAIIPRRKNEIGDNLARFVAEHFLHPDVVRNKLESVNLARNGALWLKSPRGRERMQELGVGATRWVLGALHEARVRQFIGRLGSRELARFELAPLLGRALDWLIEDGRHQGVLTQSLRFALVALHDNRETIRENVKRGSPWWLPGFVDDRILVQMLDRIETLLLELSLDPDHRLRGNFNDWVGQWAHNLQHSSEYRRWGEGLKQDLLENERLQDYLYRLWVDMVTGLESDLADPESRFSAELGRLTGGLAEELETDPAIQEWVNRWLVALAVTAVDENRLAIASLISDTVRSWDPVETSARIEQAIGRDLQFIRVNGTLVGGLVGLVIHAVKVLWEAACGRQAVVAGRRSQARSYRGSKRFSRGFLRTRSGSQTLPFITMYTPGGKHCTAPTALPMLKIASESRKRAGLRAPVSTMVLSASPLSSAAVSTMVSVPCVIRTCEALEADGRRISLRSSSVMCRLSLRISAETWKSKATCMACRIWLIWGSPTW